MNVTIQVDVSGHPEALLQRMEQALKPEQIGPLLGRAGVNLLREHFVQLDSSRPNALGGERTHFYSSAAEGTSFTVDAEGALLAVNKIGIRQRYYGGTVEAKDKLLTIPARAETYGHRASEFNDLRCITFKSGAKALVELPAAKGDKLVVMFWLRESVTQRADPTVLPSDEAMYTALNDTASEYLALITERAAA